MAPIGTDKQQRNRGDAEPLDRFRNLPIERVSW